MEIIIERGCGLDIHKGTVVACIMGTRIKKEVKTSVANLKKSIISFLSRSVPSGEKLCPTVVKPFLIFPLTSTFILYLMVSG